MNTLKFKSVAVRLTTYKMLQKLAQQNNRSAGMQITDLVEKEAKRQRRKAA
tara:strand:+ start:504 stop:656 length:153 start_codon:yes stop_codon:yes gene_type:complete